MKMKRKNEEEKKKFITIKKRNVTEERKRCPVSKFIRLTFLVLGIILFLWFLIPFTVAGILNIGNITGMILSILFIVYMGFMPVINRWVRACWTSLGKRLLILVFGSLIVLCGILATIETGCMIGACRKTPAENATAVVLGCRVYGERASLMLRERLDAAYEYLETYPEAVCVVSGGQGIGEDISEAECMRRYLVNKGIDSERIYKEDKSTSTEENMKFSLEVIKENKLNEDVVIVTNEFHLYRAGVIAGDCGLSYGTDPAQTAIWLFPTYYVRELYAILAEWIF